MTPKHLLDFFLCNPDQRIAHIQTSTDKARKFMDGVLQALKNRPGHDWQIDLTNSVVRVKGRTGMLKVCGMDQPEKLQGFTGLRFEGIFLDECGPISDRPQCHTAWTP